MYFGSNYCISKAAKANELFNSVLIIFSVFSTFLNIVQNPPLFPFLFSPCSHYDFSFLFPSLPLLHQSCLHCFSLQILLPNLLCHCSLWHFGFTFSKVRNSQVWVHFTQLQVLKGWAWSWWPLLETHLLSIEEKWALLMTYFSYNLKDIQWITFCTMVRLLANLWINIAEFSSCPGLTLRRSCCCAWP